jgi:hypothetical protein
MVLGCIYHDCKLDLVTIHGNLTDDQYTRDVLQPVVVPHFDNNPLATRPVYMDDNARPHRSRAVIAYPQSEAVTSVPWPAMSPDFNPIEHIWDMLGRRIHRYTPKPLLSLHRKGQLAGCSLGYRLYFCVSKPSSGRRLHEAETGSRLTNRSCAMSLNSNHVVLNTMPNMIVYVGLPTVDV